ncbi:unnamed protein product [Leptidea sinapis]|uniref:Flavin-containing monooxygenase n=1 Tax=Leptidea sinapis TaxID=189913 RepID=A0A5E4QRE6_9NEOP|nr:unnamed protein product [Leptidea sinapis]
MTIFKCFIIIVLIDLCYVCVNSALEMPPSDQHRPSFTCVLGAGYSGLAAARYLKQYGLNFTVFEAASDVGGTWRFDPHVGYDEYGTPLATSITNTPRQTMEFNGFPFPKTSPSYPTGPCFYKYILAFTKYFKLRDNIQTNSFVQLVKWVGNHWEVTYTKTDERENHTVSCDFVVVATGQYMKPVMPKVPGQNVFKGPIMHSHDYRGPEPFKGKKVLLVGAGASGLDLATHLVNVTEKLVHSHHLKYNQPDFPKSYKKKPDMKVFLENGVIFNDDTFEDAEYIAALIAGRFKLPSQEDMLKKWLQHDLLNYRDYDFEVIDPYHYKRWYNGGGDRGLECPLDDDTQ